MNEDVIRRAMGSAKCRIYRVKADRFCLEQHQKKAHRQEELQKVTIEALEKQIAKEPKRCLYGFSCPNCKCTLMYRPYCSECGQKIDWGEDNV